MDQVNIMPFTPTDPLLEQLHNEPALQGGLAELLRAHDLALSVGRAPAAFAVEAESLRRLGLGPSHLLWLVAAGFASHWRDRSPPEAMERDLEPGGLRLTKASCFALLPNAVPLCRGLDFAGRTTCRCHERGEGQGPREPPRPRWDAARGQLWVGQVLVKAYRQPAHNQRLVLDALEAQYWPPRIDSPLPRDDRAKGRYVLRNTLQRLNAQLVPQLRFAADGKGRGICWEYISGRPETMA